MIRPILRRPRSLALAAILGALVVSSCGKAFHTPAAVVAGTEISQDELKHELDVLLKQPQFAQQVEGPDGAERRKEFTRQLLALLIQQEVVDTYARGNGIVVTPQEILETLSMVVEQQGGQEQFDAALKSLGLTIEDVRQNIHRSLLGDKVKLAVAQARFGANATPEQQDQAFTEWQAAQFRAGGVEVNPRFGRFDPSRGSICRIDSTAATTTCSPA